jgi:hypothetical protein
MGSAISTYYGHNSSLILAVNRLSGGLPEFNDMSFYSLDVLSGNIFGCDTSVKHDENSNTNVCGSKTFNKSLILLCALVAIFAVTGICIYSYFYLRVNWLQKKYDNNLVMGYVRSMIDYYTIACDLDKSKYPNLLSFVQCLRHLVKSVWVICLSTIVLTLPIYILKGIDYDKENPKYVTHSIVYMWEITTAYITGELPGGLLLLAWLGSVIVFVLLMTGMSIRQTDASSSLNSDTDNRSKFNKAYVIFSIMLLLNIFVVGAMNGWYVYLTLLEFDVLIHTLIQISFAFTKYIWNFVIVPWILFSVLPVSPYRSWLKLFVNMLNSVFIPCIASLFTSTSCFQVIVISIAYNTSYYKSFITNLTIILREYSLNLKKFIPPMNI